jgi:hypothetical protein
MIITKTVTRTYKIQFFPNAWDIPFGRFKQTRERNKQTMKELSSCFICGHKFDDDEMPVVISVSKKGNRFSCKQCCADNIREKSDEN